MELIISPAYSATEDGANLAKVATLNGVKVNALLNSWEGNYSSLPSNALAFYGEESFCEFMGQENRYKIHSNSLDWLAKLPIDLLQRSVRFMTMGEIKKEKENVLGTRFLEAVEKNLFLSGIYTEGFPDVSDDTEVLVQADVEWFCKYRFVIINGMIATGCCYKLATSFNIPTIHPCLYTDLKSGYDALSFAKMIVSKFNTAPACILDVGFIKEHKWAVVGTYPVWSSEIYGCEPQHFLRALFLSCEPLKNKIE